MRHTKGPWGIKENGKHETPSIYAGWKHIARLKDQSNGELNANARLIASAPDLLEAVKQAAGYYHESGGQGSICEENSLCIYCQAIAKTEGET